MPLYISEQLLTLVFFFCCIGGIGLFGKKGLGLVLLIIPSSCIMISGIESIANHVSYFDRGAYQFANVILLFTGVSFYLEQESAYIQFCLNMFVAALLSHEDTDVHVSYLFIITGIISLTKNHKYMAVMFSAMVINFTSMCFVSAVISPNKYVTSLYIALPTILITVLNYWSNSDTYTKLSDERP